MTVEVLDPAGWRHAASAAGLLRTFNEAGVVDSADVHVAQRLSAMAGESDSQVVLAVALLVRADEQISAHTDTEGQQYQTWHQNDG